MSAFDAMLTYIEEIFLASDTFIQLITLKKERERVCVCMQRYMCVYTEICLDDVRSLCNKYSS